MQTSVEKIGSIGRELSVVVPAEQIESAVQDRLKKLSKQVKVQGFRPGKVPMKIVDQQYRGTATNDVLTELIQTSLEQALSKEEMIPAARPDIIPQSLEKGKDFTYVAKFDVYPEFEKLDLDGVEIIKPESEVLDEDVDKVIENMRKQQITWKEVKRKSKKEDRIIIDFAGSVDGEAFEGGSSQDYPVVIGQGQMLPDFEKGVTGMKAGDSKEIEVNFPDDYQEDMAGKKAIFKIDAKSVSEAVLPEIDKDFVESFGIASGEVDELMAEVRKNLETNLTSALTSTLRQNTFDALLEQNDVELPLKMVQEEAGRIMEQEKNQMVQQGLDPKLLEKMPEPDFEVMRPQAEKRVELGLAIMEIVRKNDIKPDEKRVKERVETMASSYEDPTEFVNYYMQNQQALAQVQSIVLEEQVVDFLIEGANVKVEKKPASELLNMQA